MVKGGAELKRRSGGLTTRERRFCEVYALGGDAAAAAVAAGYDLPEKAGVSLLSRDDINTEISRLYEKRLRNARQKAYAGYERIAFGSVSDAVRLLFADAPFGPDGEEYDLFNVAEIKRPKEGAMEIKFFDRIKALEKLEQYGRDAENGSSDFYRALVSGIGNLNNAGSAETADGDGGDEQ